MKHPFYGFGLGLRTVHYSDFESMPQPVDWLEVISDNFLVAGGKPMIKIMNFRKDYPIALHGVSMSIGSAQGLDYQYINKIKALAKLVEPMWISDHMCWSGPTQEPMHDLYPLPYTEECAALIIRHIREVQDILERRFVVENVSSYMRFSDSRMSEWAFLAHIINEADCDLLLDINNIYVSSVNHGFDPITYLDAIPKKRVRQMHLAGHSMTGDFIIDTHDHPIIPEVWSLFGEACKRFNPTATMIERDDHIPELAELLAELEQARNIAKKNGWSITADSEIAKAPIADIKTSSKKLLSDKAPSLANTQLKVAKFILNTPVNSSSLVPEIIDAGDKLFENEPKKILGTRGLEIYHNAYRVRLQSALDTHFHHLMMYMGEYFNALTLAYVETHPSVDRQLGNYGDKLAAFIQERYPDDPALYELAQLESALRSRFDCADAPAWSIASIKSEGTSTCLTQSSILHPSVVWLSFKTNVIAIWRAIEDDVEVPEVKINENPINVIVWRKGLVTQFVSLESAEADFLQALKAPNTNINDTTETFAKDGKLSDPQVLAAWLGNWWEMEILSRS